MGGRERGVRPAQLLGAGALGPCAPRAGRNGEGQAERATSPGLGSPALLSPSGPGSPRPALQPSVLVHFKAGHLIVQLSDRWRTRRGTKLACHCAVQNAGEATPRGAGCHAQHAPAHSALLCGPDSEENVRNWAHRENSHLQSRRAGDRRDGPSRREPGAGAFMLLGRWWVGCAWPAPCWACVLRPACGPPACFGCSRPPTPRDKGKQGQRLDGPRVRG